MQAEKKILVIIPAYNEQDNIAETLNNLKEYAPEVDYVVINDCSRDNTLNILKDNLFSYIDLPVNLGIGGGVQTGYMYAYKNGYDVAIQMDGDGQHDAQYIKTLVKPIFEGNANVVIGSRYISKEGFQSSVARRIGSNVLSGLIYMCCGCKVKDVTSGFRAADRKAIELFVNDYAQDYPEPEAIVACALSGLKIVEIPVVMKERCGGVSSISKFKSIYYMIKVSIAILLKRTFIRKR